ncbi:MAG: stage II sporulation protein R [Clostridiales bacterium]|nr:stage II sporulation protein R [Clostridiales bacterium]
MFINKRFYKIVNPVERKKGRCFERCWSTRIVLLILAVFLHSSAAAIQHSSLQQRIAEKVVRFHILANSDSAVDQNIKYEVRDAVLAWISEAMPEYENRILSQEVSVGSKTGSALLPEEELTDWNDRDKVLQFLSGNLSQIEEAANDVLEVQGVSYHASVELTQSYFPDRTYGNCTFPAGWYEALRICLGSAKGRNWWCLIYPGLCFTDCLHAVVEDDELSTLEEILTVEEYQSLLQSPDQWKLSFRWFQ